MIIFFYKGVEKSQTEENKQNNINIKITNSYNNLKPLGKLENKLKNIMNDIKNDIKELEIELNDNSKQIEEIKLTLHSHDFKDNIGDSIKLEEALKSLVLEYKQIDNKLEKLYDQKKILNYLKNYEELGLINFKQAYNDKKQELEYFQNEINKLQQHKFHHLLKTKEMENASKI